MMYFFHLAAVMLSYDVTGNGKFDHTISHNKSLCPPIHIRGWLVPSTITTTSLTRAQYEAFHAPIEQRLDKKSPSEPDHVEITTSHTTNS
jgi:hypothetical protein